MPLTVANASIPPGRTIGGEPRDLIHHPKLVQNLVRAYKRKLHSF